MVRKPLAAVFAERGPTRHRLVYSLPGLWWAQFVIGLRSWLSAAPSPVYTLALGDYEDAGFWLEYYHADCTKLRDGLIASRDRMRTAAQRPA